jgi:Adenylate and Guanylate cyclase catalytic domain
MLSDNTSNQPTILTAAVAAVFIFTIMMFFVYNRLVEKRQKSLLTKAAESTAIVSSMFPKQVRGRLLQGVEDNAMHSISHDNMFSTRKNSIGKNSIGTFRSQIADLFPECTVLFADIVGFTAWSSTRGPEHVFILLETLYQNFDRVAKRRRVFKVETIGDCYLAVTGLPNPQTKHALIMVRFASECKKLMTKLTRDLETQLGPDSSDLRMRFGIHSGPVTAGVLRGERARFQLFGDTVNTGMYRMLLDIMV